MTIEVKNGESQNGWRKRHHWRTLLPCRRETRPANYWLALRIPGT